MPSLMISVEKLRMISNEEKNRERFGVARYFFSSVITSIGRLLRKTIYKKAYFYFLDSCLKTNVDY